MDRRCRLSPCASGAPRRPAPSRTSGCCSSAVRSRPSGHGSTLRGLKRAPCSARSPAGVAKDTAEGHHAPIPVRVLALTGDHALPDPGIQNQSRFLPAAIALALGVETRLPALRRVDAKQPDALAMDLDDVAERMDESGDLAA